MLTIGQKAPDFTLFNTARKEVSIHDFQGKNLIILFFPMAFTSTCTAELCEMRDNIGVYSGLNAEVVGISVDSPFTLAKFKEDQNLPFDLLSDFNKEVSQAYDTYYETFAMNLKGVSKRSAFVVDKNGLIQYVEVLENAGNVPNFQAIQETLTSLN
ncbi:redoxin domain-containing protein [Spirosoma sp. HMF4905]|uniref:Redoxin domain-containing protein n=1 Tax=Spirosoma arboris TaxID=2682092 RepID=A0A7K1SJX6_9BACT|nr:peroxiredoxin [Spirosoma arboris]MVM34038.1 redoxin domain-containing protein [Spirosoma arboris]